MASFPNTTRSYTNKVDLTDTIYADHINALQEEVSAIETFLAGITTSDYSGTFANTTTWTTLEDRLLNIEAGLMNGVTSSPYFKKSGDLVSPTSGVVGMLIQTTGGTANIFEARDSSSVLGFNVTSTGIPKMGSNNILYATSSEYTSITSGISAVTSTANAANSLATTANNTANTALATATAGVDLTMVMTYGLLLAGM